jgi:hypothetical protein
MSVSIVPNSGILFDDRLDRLRSDALMACQDGLPESLVYYLSALEVAFLERKLEEHRRSLRDIGWKHLPPEDEP